MDLIKSKRGVATSHITSWAAGLVGVIVLVMIAASLVPEATTATQTLNTSGVPLGGLSASIVPLAIMAGLIVAVVAFAMRTKK